MAQQTAPTSLTKSVEITAIDASPPTRYTAGQGGPGRNVSVCGHASITATQATTVGTRLVRIPSNAIVRSVKLCMELNGGTATTVTGNVGLLFSDANDGTPLLNQGQLKPYSSCCFAYQVAFAAIVTPTEYAFNNAAGNSATDGFYVPTASIMPIWLALSQGGPGPQTDGAWAGLGATSLSSAPGYQLNLDPGGFFDLFFQPTTTTNISIAMYMFAEVTYTTT